MIRDTADMLAERPWSVIQLTLRQFGLGTYEPDDFNGPAQDVYCSEQIEPASDEILQDLYGFLLDEATSLGPSVGESESVWSSSRAARVFLSHTHDHRTFAGDVKTQLEVTYGIEAFVAHNDISPSVRSQSFAVKQEFSSFGPC